MSASGGGREIERVWVLRAAPAVPDDARVERWEVEQGYLAPVAEREQDLAARGYPEGRVRRIVEPDGAERFIHTVKSGSGMVRREEERPLTRAEFDALWPRTKGRRIAKTRLRVREAAPAAEGASADGLVWEVDLFHGLPLVMVEVELRDESQQAPLPAWIAPLVVREVTDDPRYRNFALAVHGVPGERP